MLYRIVFGTALLLASFQVVAQKGAIAGTVYDPDGFPMLGANVVIQGTTQGAQTDFIEGKYQFQVDPGTYTLVASYVGFGEQVIEDVEVLPNETTILDITFSEDTGVELNLDVTVTAQALERGEVAVLRLRENSDKVQDIISSQEIQRLGAGTAAAALTKVTGTTVVDGKYVYVRGLGDRYSATTLNGLRLPSIDPYRNSAQLDLIPTNLLDNIVASKTFTPDLPGDFTGGSVNVKLKALPERFTFGVSVATAYNAQSNFRDDFLSFDAGSRAGLGYNDGSLDRPDILDDPRISQYDILSSSSARRAIRDDATAAVLDQTARSFTNGFGQQRTNTPLDYSISANIGNQFNLGSMPIGVFASLSYSRDYSQYKNGLRANYINPMTGERLQEEFNLRDNQSIEAPKIGGMLGLSFRPSSASTINLYGIYSHQAFIEGRSLIGANNEFGLGGTEDNYFASQTNSFLSRDLRNYVIEGQHVLTGLGNTKIEWAGNYVDSEQNEPDLRFLAYTVNGGFPQINPAQLILPSHFYRDLSDNNYQGKLDITVPFLQGKSRGNAIKFGGLYNTKDRDFNETTYVYENRNGISFGEANGDPGVYFGDDNLGVIGGEPGRNTIGLYITDNTQLSNSYVGAYDIYAGYGMVTYEVSPKFKVIGGLRLEGTKIDIVSDLAALALNPEDYEAHIDTMAVLPALNLVYKLKEGQNLRASFSQTIARPNMREVAPFGSFGFIGEPPVFGNPDLSVTSIDNYDLRYEIFPNAGEVIAISAFYKRFRDPIVTTFRNAGEQQFTWTNSESASLYGIELEFRKSLAFIGSSFSNFTFSSNVSYIESVQDIDDQEYRNAIEIDPDFPETRPFNGQSPWIVNANLGYATPESGWDVFVSYNYFADRLTSIGAVGASDIFERGRHSLDVNLTKKIKNITLSARARNLLNPKYETFSDFKGAEYLFSSYERGREFSFGISYGI